MQGSQVEQHHGECQYYLCCVVVVVESESDARDKQAHCNCIDEVPFIAEVLTDTDIMCSYLNNRQCRWY